MNYNGYYSGVSLIDQRMLISAAIKTCLKIIDNANNLEQIHINSQIENLFSVKNSLEKKQKIANRLILLLDKQNGIYEKNNNINIAKTLSGQLSIINGYGKEAANGDYITNFNNKATDAIRYISSWSNPVIPLKKYISQYIDIIKAIEKQEEIKKQAKQREDNKRKINNDGQESFPKTQYPTPSPRPSYDYTSYTKNDSSMGVMIPKTYLTQDIKEKIRELVSSKDLIITFTPEEKNLINRILQDFNPNNNNKYYTIDVLKKGIIIENIFNKLFPNIEDVMEMALNTYDVMTYDLVYNSSRKTAECELFNGLNMAYCLNKYMAVYNKFNKYFKLLPSQRKEEIKERIKANSNYVKLFGSSIVTPNELIDKINNNVIEKTVEKSQLYGISDPDDFLKQLFYSTRFMNIDYIQRFYKRIKPTCERNTLNLAEYQKDFAIVVLNKLESYNKEKDSSKMINMSDEDKKKLAEKRYAMLQLICGDVFKELPIFVQLEQLQVIPDIYKDEYQQLKSSYDAKQSVRSKVYNISKVQKAFLLVTGKWQKYLRLIDKEVLSENEQKELTGIFNR